jgi:hypothetical protein
MSAPDALAESLMYPDTKRRAVASRSYRTKISPNNGQTFSAGQVVNIDMPSNLAGTYVNWNQCYLKFKLKTTGAGRLDRCGAAGLISRVSCFTSGAQIFDLPNWNVLMTILMDTDSSPAYKAGIGNVLMGTHGGYQAGEALVVGDAGVRTFCVPFALHPFAMSTPHRLMPLFSAAPVQFKITLESIALATVGAISALDFTEVELVCIMTELSPGAQAQVDQMSGGMYNILASSYQNVGTTMSAGNTAVTANLGLSVSSLERVIVCHRPTATLVALGYSLGNRAKNFLTEYSILINGEQYPARPVLVSDKGAEALAEYLLSDHSLVNFDKQSSFNIAVAGITNATKTNGLDGQSVYGIVEPFVVDNPTGTNPGSTDNLSSNIGSFITAVELETGLSDGKSQRIYSGISTISSTVNYRGVYSAGTVDAQIDFFAMFTVLLSLNMRGTGVWSVSV